MASAKFDSPCTRRCTLDPETDVCLGCYRTLAEILAWSKYSARQRLAVLERLASRQDDYARKRELRRTQKSD